MKKSYSSKGSYIIGDRDLYVNMNGGLKADGNPLGASGGAMFYEIFKQLKGEAGERQINSGSLSCGCIQELEGRR